MRRTIFVLLITFLSIVVIAQNDSIRSKFAKVNVSVVDMAGKASKGEEILFKSEATKSIVSGISDAGGKLSLQLPIGDKYVITVKRITDTSKYGSLVIPPLAADEFYTEPFKVNVKFAMAKTYTLKNVHFDFGKATLRADSFAELEELVSFLKHKDDIRVEIAGHTDNVGKDADNLKLSQQRAEAIRNYVTRKGISPSRIMAKGYGAAEPVADNDTDESRQLNRRTEVRIL